MELNVPMIIFVLAVAIVGVRLRGSGDVQAAMQALTYDYAYHGQNWQQGQCASRERQSPIDFGASAPWGEMKYMRPSRVGTFHFNYQPVTDFVLQNSGYAVAADFTRQGYGGITFDLDMPGFAGWYNLLAMSFHAKSEHTFYGQQLPLEVHLVHKRYDGDALIVVAVGLNTTGGSHFLDLDPFLKAPETYARDNVLIPQPLDLNEVVKNGTYFEYDGSLTVPPCTENAIWLVRREPLRVSPDVIEVLQHRIYDATTFGNYRAACPLMDREIRVMTAVQGEPVAKVPNVTEPPVGPGNIFRGYSAAHQAVQNTLEANADLQELEGRLLAGSEGHLEAAPELKLRPLPPLPVETTDEDNEASWSAQQAEAQVTAIKDELERQATLQR